MKKLLIYSFLTALLTMQFSIASAQAELEIKGSLTSLLKDKAIVKGHVPRQSESYDIVGTEIKEINGRQERVYTRGREHDGMFLGVTVIINTADGQEEEIDFRPRLVQGNFREDYNISSTKVMGALSIKWIARLWKGRVSRYACREGNGVECKYCRKNGFHFYQSVERAVW